MWLVSRTGRRKIPKTLSGIETLITDMVKYLCFCAGKYLKPYQGLKQLIRTIDELRDRAGKYLKPYQGLKLKY